jgi:ferredoxin
VLEIVKPSLTIMDGVLGQEGEGPGVRGTPRSYGCLAASTDPVALDSVLSTAMGLRPGQVLHLAQAASRELGVTDPGAIRIVGDAAALRFGHVTLPAVHWYFRAPSWLTSPISRSVRVRPAIEDMRCAGCGQCAVVCPRDAITTGRPPIFDLEACVGCMCCAEICPQGAIRAHESWMARLIGTR